MFARKFKQRRARVRWLVVGMAIAAMLGAAVLWQVSRPRPAEESRAAYQPATVSETEESVTQAPAHPPVPSLEIVSPASPLPETAEQLIDEVQGLVDGLMAAFPDNPDCIELKARVYDWLGDSEGAMALRIRCLEIAPNYAHAYIGMAHAAQQRGDHQEAADLARKALAADSTSTPARIAAVDSLLRLGQPEEAITLLQDSPQPITEEQALCLYGEAELQLGQFEDALKRFDAALAANSDSVAALNGKAQVYARMGQHDKAKEFRRKFRDKFIERPRRDYLRQTRRDDLNAMFEKAAKFYHHAAQVCRAHNRPLEAEQLWRRALSMSPKDKEIRGALAQFYATAGKPDEALRQLNELAKAAPDDAEIRLQLAVAYAGLNRLEQSEQALREACEIAPDQAKYPATLATFYLKVNRNLPQAVILARRAVELEPTAANYARLAATLQRSGDPPAALSAINEAVQLDPQHAEYRRMKELIQTQVPP